MLSDERTAADIVAEAVARTWIDQPATALRLDCLPQPSDAGLGAMRLGAGLAPASRPPIPLPERELRRLVEQVTAARLEVSRLGYDNDGLGREHEAITDRQARVESEILDAERRLMAARRSLEERDRPLHRRGHRAEITAAHRDVADLPERIDELAGMATELEEDLTINEGEVRRIRAEQARAEATHDQLERRLDDDATTRGEAASLDPDPPLVANLDAVPDDRDGGDRWIRAAGRADQHRKLWPIPEGQVLGSRPRSLGEDDYATTHYRTEQSLAALQRSRGVEPIGRDLRGLSL